MLNLGHYRKEGMSTIKIMIDLSESINHLKNNRNYLKLYKYNYFKIFDYLNKKIKKLLNIFIK